LKKVAVQGQVTLPYLCNECLWTEAATDLGASTSTDKLSIFIATFALRCSVELYRILSYIFCKKSALFYTLHVLTDIKQGLTEAVQIRGCQPTICFWTS